MNSPGRPRARAGENRSTPRSSRDASRFRPGDMLAGRYRMVSLLGRGSMGEVYRADDLKLGQSVALKFLPTGLEPDEKALKDFHHGLLGSPGVEVDA